MAWTGKIIGGVLGSLINPIAAAVGVAIGHQFDKGSSKLSSTQQTIQVAFLGCLAKMARADGVITQEEINAVEQIMVRFGYAGPMREQAIAIFRKAKDDPHTAGDYLNQLSSAVQFNSQIAMTFISALHSVATADGIIHPNEREILLQAERAFQLPAGTIDAILGHRQHTTASSAIDNAYRVLEISPNSTDAEIKKVYRQKCIEFHPDKLASKGLPEEFMTYAHDQLSKVNEAYDILKKSRNL